MNKSLTVLSVLIAAGLVGFALFGFGGAPAAEGPERAVEVVDGKQIINVVARGGYQPRVITASANMQSVLRVETKNTFDCSAAFTIPSQNIRKFLPSTGITEFELPPQEPGSEIQGLCSMGMYSFTIKFI